MSTEAPKVSLLVFFLIWAKRMRWQVPDIHVRALVWLEHKEDLAVLRCFRGFGKSTLLAIYNAWRYYCDPTFRILHQSESDRCRSKYDLRIIMFTTENAKCDARHLLRYTL